MPKSDLHYLKIALKEAQKSLAKNEVPVGAIIVKDNKIIARGHNTKEKHNDVTSHAEIIAIKKAAKKLKDWRLTDCVLYTTLEPCPMCAGAILHARLKKVVYGAPDLKWGAAGTKVDLFGPKIFNHLTEIISLNDRECAKILTNFFSKKRMRNKT